MSVFRQDDVPCEAFANVAGGGFDEAIAEEGVIDQAIDGVGEFLGLGGGDEKTGQFIFDDIADAGDVGGDDWNSGGHGFDENQTESFGGGGENQQADL